eukprot:360996-Chlamydomonas_euryale.AAC.5
MHCLHASTQRGWAVGMSTARPVPTLPDKPQPPSQTLHAQVRVNGPGGPIPMPGLLAKWYGEMGGTATLMGKPAPAIYEAAMSALDLSPKDVIAIGDSLEHDIAGAAAAGIDSLLIAGGIHAADLGVEPGARQGPVNVDRGALAQLCERHHASPTYVAGFLEW